MIVNLYSNSCTEMVAVLYETGSLMAYILYPDSTGILQELYGCKAIRRQSSGHYQSLCKRVSDQQQSENRLQGRTLLIISHKIKFYETACFRHIRNPIQR
jgi:hypothetical protein